MSHFFAYMARMKYIFRWGLMRNTRQENILEHTAQVAMIAHALAVISNRRYEGAYSPERAAALALYHEAGEVITGDLATPIKYFNSEISSAYKRIESMACGQLWRMLPEELQEDFEPYVVCPEEDAHWALVKAADRLCAYLKCVEELKAGNSEFLRAHDATLKLVRESELPAVGYFLEKFAPSFNLTLDELNP